MKREGEVPSATWEGGRKRKNGSIQFDQSNLNQPVRLKVTEIEFLLYSETQNEAQNFKKNYKKFKKICTF